MWGTQIERATGTAVDANLFGGLMMIATAIIAGQLTAQERILPPAVLVAAGLVSLTGLGLSLSRSAWVGAATALALLGVLVDRRALIVLLVGTVVAVAVPGSRDRIAGALLVRDEASLLRVEEYRASVALLAEHPAIGVGFGPAFGLDLVRRVSNMYLLIGEEMGLTGLASLLIVLALLLRQTFRPVPPAAPEAGALAGLQAALAGGLTVGLFDHYFMNSLFPHTAGLFWLLASLLTVAARPSPAPPAPAGREPRPDGGEPADA